MNGGSEVDVLVVGAGLVGLAATAFLAQQGVRVLCVERHAGTSDHPKARLVGVRAMELYRALGVEDEVRAAGEPNSGFVVADSLSEEFETWIAPPADMTTDEDLSPSNSYSCDQQRLEPILLNRCEALGATVAFDTSASGVAQDDAGVSTTLRDGTGTRTIRSRYCVAADGARSGVRAALDVEWRGEPVPGVAVSAVFTADLTEALRGREVNALMARKAGAFLFARGDRGDRQWQLGTYLRPEWSTAGGRDALWSELVPLIRTATGLPRLDPQLQSVMTWETGAYVASRFRHGRVFLAGDAAHVMPQYGGFGGNTGVQDAHNLAWKLAAVLRGDAGDGLLDTYDLERHGMDELVVAQALLRSRKRPGQGPSDGEIDAVTLDLGFRYPTRPDDGGATVEDPRAPSGVPGTRAGHARLTDGRSLLDLLDPSGFTFVHPGVTRFEAVPGPPAIRMVLVRPHDVAASHRARFESTYGSGALVRPDGVIAWRSTRSSTPADVIAATRRLMLPPRHPRP